MVVVVLDDAADAVAGGRDLLLTITLQCRRLSRQSHHSLHLQLRYFKYYLENKIDFQLNIYFAYQLSTVVR